MVDARCWSIPPTKPPFDVVCPKQQTYRLDTVCHRRQGGGLDAARKLTSTLRYTRLYSIILQRPLGREGLSCRYSFLQTANLCCRDECTREWIVEQFATITGGVRIPGRSPPLGHFQQYGEVGWPVVQRRHMRLEAGRSRSTRGSSRESRKRCSVAPQPSVCFCAGLTRLRRLFTSSRVALPLQLCSASKLSTLSKLTDTHAHSRLASRGLTCRRSLTWQQRQAAVVQAGSQASASWHYPQEAAANPRSATPLSISTSREFITARTSKRSESNLPPRSPPCTRPPSRPAPAQCWQCAWPSSISTASPAPGVSLSFCIRFVYLLPNCVLVSVTLTRRGYTERPAQCAIVAAHTH